MSERRGIKKPTKGYSLYVREDGRSFWNEEVTVDIILHQSMGHSQGNHGVPTFFFLFTNLRLDPIQRMIHDELTEVLPSVNIQDMEEKAYRQWWADDACPPRHLFLLEPS